MRNNDRNYKLYAGVAFLFAAAFLMLYEVLFMGDFTGFKKLLSVTVNISISSALCMILFMSYSRTKYKYNVEDDYLVIKRKISNKTKLKINLEQIVSVERPVHENPLNIEKEYNFYNSGDLVYRCIFKKDGKLYSVNFEPNLSTLNKINKIKKAS
jgi:hypothetical protein